MDWKIWLRNKLRCHLNIKKGIVYIVLDSSGISWGNFYDLVANSVKKNNSNKIE